MNAVAAPTVASILADLKADLYGSPAFDHAAFDDASTEDRHFLHGVNSCHPADQKIIATPRMRDDYFGARKDQFSDEADFLTWKVSYAEAFADTMRREFLP